MDPRGGGGSGEGAGDEGGEGGRSRERKRVLHSYEIVALTNLNPPSVAAAKSLIPSLDELEDTDLNDAITLLRKTSARSGAYEGGSGEGGNGMEA